MNETGLNDRLDVIFPVNGSTIPRDHGYSLYAAISRLVPSVHEAKDTGIFPIRGQNTGDGALFLTDRSALRLRLPAARIPAILPLAGKVLELDGHRLRVGVPRVAPLVPAPTLASSLVLINPWHEKGTPMPQITPDLFLEAVKRQMGKLGVGGEAGIQAITDGPRKGQARRRTLRIKDRVLAGYALIIQGLTADESIRLQAEGIGGKRLMGCGLFLELKS